jgi:hypothetical protein
MIRSDLAAFLVLAFVAAAIIGHSNGQITKEGVPQFTSPTERWVLSKFCLHCARVVWLAIGRHVNSSRQVLAIFHDMNCETLAFRLAL